MNFNLFCDFCNLRQYNNVVNRYGGMLDLVLSNLESEQVMVSTGLDPLVPIDHYHPVLEVRFKLPVGSLSTTPPTNVRPKTRPDWNWRKADLLGLYGTLADIDWSDLFNVDDADSAVDLFYTKLYDRINCFVPSKTKFTSNKQYIYPKWYTADIIRNINL